MGQWGLISHLATSGFTVSYGVAVDIRLIASASRSLSAVAQYLGITHHGHGADNARFSRIISNTVDALIRQFAFYVFKANGLSVLA
ncbi:MAG: hypothetical protein N2Z74_01675 [Syntrophales bacterium]|nr:hypothetical protein [Syntrophales bacterium]